MLILASPVSGTLAGVAGGLLAKRGHATEGTVAI